MVYSAYVETTSSCILSAGIGVKATILFSLTYSFRALNFCSQFVPLIGDYVFGVSLDKVVSTGDFLVPLSSTIDDLITVVRILVRLDIIPHISVQEIRFQGWYKSVKTENETHGGLESTRLVIVRSAELRLVLSYRQFRNI